MIGIGGSPEAVIAAAGIIALGGNIQIQIVSKNDGAKIISDTLVISRLSNGPMLLHL
jgi:fructose-1,6-bisphosphatase/sedoheptulose 1,7-bisphosphatase-like protein